MDYLVASLAAYHWRAFAGSKVGEAVKRLFAFDSQPIAACDALTGPASFSGCSL
jgi:hypothetical protein